MKFWVLSFLLIAAMVVFNMWREAATMSPIKFVMIGLPGGGDGGVRYFVHFEGKAHLALLTRGEPAVMEPPNGH